MEISARNGIKGTVEIVKLGEVMASIKIKFKGEYIWVQFQKTVSIVAPVNISEEKQR